MTDQITMATVEKIPLVVTESPIRFNPPAGLTGSGLQVGLKPVGIKKLEFTGNGEWHNMWRQLT